MYQRIASADPSADPANLDNRQNRLTWLPFHFLPGNAGLPAGENPIRSCITTQERPYGLQRLGITMHVLADTFAHQGFAGVRDEINTVTSLEETGTVHRRPGAVRRQLFLRIQSWRDQLLEQAVPPVGHGRALTLPDMPFLQWQYMNGR